MAKQHTYNDDEYEDEDEPKIKKKKSKVPYWNYFSSSLCFFLSLTASLVVTGWILMFTLYFAAMYQIASAQDDFQRRMDATQKLNKEWDKNRGK